MIKNWISTATLVAIGFTVVGCNSSSDSDQTVAEQSYIYGRDANVEPMENIYNEIEEGQITDIENVIVR
jgi:uncharacterized lipoprotein NlpE involved in copper resistance